MASRKLSANQIKGRLATKKAAFKKRLSILSASMPASERLMFKVGPGFNVSVKRLSWINKHMAKQSS